MRTKSRLLAALALLLGTVTVAGAAAHADVPEIGHCRADAVLGLGSSGGSVICLQWAMLWTGDLHGTLSGAYDQATSNAVIHFQQDHPPLTVNGIAGAETLKAMGIFSGVDKAPPLPCVADSPVKPGDRGVSTQCVQQALKKRSLFLGRVDGTFGADTKAALAEFQRLHPPLAATGIGDTSTLAALGVWSGFTKSTPGAPVAGNWWPSGFQAEPNWRVNAQGIPYFNGHLQCSRADADTIASEFAKDGADPETQQYFIYIASREGGCDYKRVNVNPATHDDSHCAFQINALSGVFEPDGQLGRRGWTADNVEASMAACADAASDLWVYCARGPWTAPNYSCTPPWTGDLGAEGDV